MEMLECTFIQGVLFKVPGFSGVDVQAVVPLQWCMQGRNGALKL